jgi:hypothetical protein
MTHTSNRTLLTPPGCDSILQAWAGALGPGSPSMAQGGDGAWRTTPPLLALRLPCPSPSAPAAVAAPLSHHPSPSPSMWEQVQEVQKGS